MSFIEKIPVIIINYRTSHLMQKVIDSIQEDKVDIQIIILDNGSTPESFHALREIKDDRVTILRSVKNLGFTGGVNFVLKYIIDNLPDARFTFLFNPDALSTVNLISGLTDRLKSNANAACISPQILHTNGVPAYSGSRINYKKGTVSTSLKKEDFPNRDVYDVDAFTGCAVLIDLKKIAEVGMFNEKLFMYYDEADVSIRLKASGYKILYTPEYKVFHDYSYTTRNISYVKTYYMTRNKFFLFGRTMSFYYKTYFVLYELAFHLKHKKIKNAYYHLKGLLHSSMGKQGNIFSEI